jgi:predicted transposase YdaD
MPVTPPDPTPPPSLGSRAADLGGRKLIGLLPDDWLRFVTSRPDIRSLEQLEGSLQWVGRETDVLLRVVDPEAGEFLVAIELQLHPDRNMPLRVDVYAALGEQKYGLPVYPVVINILPGAASDVDRYESTVLDLSATRDFRVINLWEQDAQAVVDSDIVGLLPFVPVMRGGDDPALLERVLDRLRRTPELAGMEGLLAKMASHVLEKKQVLDIMRWDMEAATRLTFYEEILSEGIEQGLEQGREQGHHEAALEILQRVLGHRFGAEAQTLAADLKRYDLPTLERLLDAALDAVTLGDFRAGLPPIASPS